MLFSFTQDIAEVDPSINNFKIMPEREANTSPLFSSAFVPIDCGSETGTCSIYERNAPRLVNRIDFV